VGRGGTDRRATVAQVMIEQFLGFERSRQVQTAMVFVSIPKSSFLGFDWGLTTKEIKRGVMRLVRVINKQKSWYHGILRRTNGGFALFVERHFHDSIP